MMTLNLVRYCAVNYMMVMMTTILCMMTTIHTHQGFCLSAMCMKNILSFFSHRSLTEHVQGMFLVVAATKWTVFDNLHGSCPVCAHAEALNFVLACHMLHCCSIHALCFNLYDLCICSLPLQGGTDHLAELN
ncbi:hypothetical protein ABZP36_002457 [Zizania latifolia]